MVILVLTISDRAARGIYADTAGPVIEQILQEAIAGVQLRRLVIADEEAAIFAAFAAHADCDAILTTGGTGLSPRDITPEVTEHYCDRLIPGIAETLRRESCAQTPQAMLSRSVAGQKGSTIIVNLPGSLRAVTFCTRLLIPVLTHAPRMIRGEGHDEKGNVSPQ